MCINNLDDYLNKINKVNVSLLRRKYKKLDYEDLDEFEIDLELLLGTKYNELEKENINCSSKNIDYYKIKKKQTRNQKKFREFLLKKFNNKCAVCDIENKCILESAHIQSFETDKNFNINNGLLLCANDHKLFDNFDWSINPQTNKIVVKNKNSINYKYNGKIVDLSIESKKYIQWHFDNFVNKK